jgi:ribonuclease BN (tRNA processing enzyme)
MRRSSPSAERPLTAPPPLENELTVVGSGTAAPHPRRVGASFHVRREGVRLLLDCGPGALHHLARFALPWDRLTHVALTHFHTDHIGDLPALLFALRYTLPVPRQEALTIIGPAGTRALLERLAAAFGPYVLEPGFPLVVEEIGGEAPLPLAPGVELRAAPTPHTAASVAYRLETPSGALGYTGDTGASEALGDLFEGVHFLITECSLPDEHAMATHLTPARAAALARRARPARLLLTHLYPPLEGRDVPALVRASGWGGPTEVVEDGFRYVW